MKQAKRINSNKRKINRISQKLDNIKLEFPKIDFNNAKLRRAFSEFTEKSDELIILKVDLDYCQSNDENKICSKCQCWKQSRLNTM